MDPPSFDLLPNALFSPSKAAQQRAQAQEWHQVDSWLAAKYQGRSIPQFERNEDTLKALLTLSAANEKADEERDLLWNVQKEALVELKTAREHDSSYMAVLEAGLDARGREALEVLADIATKLDVPDTDAYTMAETLCTRTQTSQVLAQQLLHLTQLQKTLEQELSYLRAQLQELRSPAFQAPLSLQRQTLDWNRNTKQLKTKLSEYSDRLSSLNAQASRDPSGEIQGILQKEESISELEEAIAATTSKIAAYKGLPKDKEAAVAKVKTLEADVWQLQKKLDSLFEQMVEKG